MGDSVDKFTKRVGDAKLKMLGFGVAMGVALNSGIKLEKAIANVGAVAGATDSQLEELSNEARKWGKSTAFSASQAAEAQYALASSGQAVHEITKSLGPVLKLAGATQFELGETAEIVAGALTSFSLAAEKSERVTNVFAAAIGKTPLNMRRLQLSMAQAGAISNAFGFSIEGTTAILGAFHKSGIKGERAGTSLKGTLAKLGNQSKELQGILGGATLKTHSFADIIDILNEKGLEGQDVLRLFGDEAGPGLAALLSQGGDAIRQLEKDITGTNKASEVYAKQMDTVSGKLAEVKSKAEEFGIKLFKSMSSERLKSALVAVGGLIDDIGEGLLGSQDDIASAIELVTSGLTKFREIAASMISGFNALPPVFKTLGIAGAFIFGVKGVAVLSAVSIVADTIGTIAKAYGQGISVAKIIMSGKDDLKEMIEGLNKVPEGPEPLSEEANAGFLIAQAMKEASEAMGKLNEERKKAQALTVQSTELEKLLHENRVVFHEDRRTKLEFVEAALEGQIRLTIRETRAIKDREDALNAEIQTVAKQAQSWENFGNKISMTFVNAMRDADGFFIGVVDGFRNMLTQMALEIVSKWVVFKAINMFSGGTFGAGKGFFDIAKSVLGFEKGGLVPQFPTGGIVGGSGAVPAIVHSGEFVINKQATDRNFDILNRINQGLDAAGGGGNVNVSLNVENFIGTQEFAESLISPIETAVREGKSNLQLQT